MKGKKKNKLYPLILVFIIVFVPIITVVLLEKIDLAANKVVAEDPEIVIEDEYEDTVPVISENNMIINPYYDGGVTIGKTYYDFKGEAEAQEKSIIANDGTYYQNTGIDFVSESVFDVVAIKDGTVINIREDDNTGKIVEIEHDDTLISMYQSLSEIDVQKGDTISQGQLIGKSGTNKLDKELGNHLHLEIYRNGNPVNPENYLNKEYQREN